ncbi:MAG: outer membrane beta-barrel protein [Holosporaceae bacterium]
MKKLLLASALLALTAAPVMADEAQDTAPEPVEYDAQDTGSSGGFYGGLQAMYAMQWIKKGDTRQNLARQHLADPKGFGGGLFLGYGHIFNRFYLGGELAYAYGAVNAKKSSILQGVPGEIKTQLQHFADVAIHPGVVLPHGFTPYGILGFRYVRGKLNIKTLVDNESFKAHGIGPRLGLGCKWKPSASPFFVGVEAAWSSIKMKVKGNEDANGLKTNNMDVKVKVGYQF